MKKMIVLVSVVVFFVAAMFLLSVPKSYSEGGVSLTPTVEWPLFEDPLNLAPTTPVPYLDPDVLGYHSFVPLILIQPDYGESDAPASTELYEMAELTIGDAAAYDRDAAKDIQSLQPSEKEVPLPDSSNFLVPQQDDVKSESGEFSPQAIAGWATIMSQGFEGVFPPSGWRVLDGNGASNGEYFWDDDDYKPYSGYWSAWLANGGANGLDPQIYYYPNNANSWMIYGPFDLSNATDAELTFRYWNQSELNYDYFGWYASANGMNFYGYRTSGDSGGWSYRNFDLTSVPGLGNLKGDSSVWIAFVFQSDGSVVDDGAFVDEIVLRKYVNAGGCPSSQYTAQYYNNLTLSGTPSLTQCENWPINKNWGTSSPGNGIGADNFSVRWTGNAYINAGTYTFIANADDGIRVWLDGSLLIDAWRDQSPTEYRVTRSVTAGTHAIKVEYYEKGGGATAQFRWVAGQSCPTISGWQGQYWNNKNLSGTAVVCRNDANVNFNWATGSPVYGIPAIGSDSFSARWTRSVYFGSAGTYRFRLSGDDGVRLWVDGNLKIDQWRDQGYTQYTTDVNLSAGNHSLKVEYYENGGAAAVALSWERLSAIDYHLRDGFHVFRVDLWNPSVTFETVMADDVSSGHLSNREYVYEMVTRSPYAVRNPILAFNADYFGNGHGAEGLTVKNGVRLPNAGTVNNDERRRSSISISSSRSVRIGRQTDCLNNCSNWVPDSSRYYTTVGGGPLFIDGGQRIGAAGSTKPCTDEYLATRYCTDQFRWTAVGISSDGRYLIVIVSGIAKTMDQAASVLIAEGAWRAMKLDSGSSSQVWYRPSGRLVDGVGIANAVLVFAP